MLANWFFGAHSAHIAERCPDESLQDASLTRLQSIRWPVILVRKHNAKVTYDSDAFDKTK